MLYFFSRIPWWIGGQQWLFMSRRSRSLSSIVCLPIANNELSRRVEVLERELIQSKHALADAIFENEFLTKQKDSLSTLNAEFSKKFDNETKEYEEKLKENEALFNKLAMRLEKSKDEHLKLVNSYSELLQMQSESKETIDILTTKLEKKSREMQKVSSENEELRKLYDKHKSHQAQLMLNIQGLQLKLQNKTEALENLQQQINVADFNFNLWDNGPMEVANLIPPDDKQKLEYYDIEQDSKAESIDDGSDFNIHNSDSLHYEIVRLFPKKCDNSSQTTTFGHIRNSINFFVIIILLPILYAFSPQLTHSLFHSLFKIKENSSS